MSPCLADLVYLSHVIIIFFNKESIVVIFRFAVFSFCYLQGASENILFTIIFMCVIKSEVEVTKPDLLIDKKSESSVFKCKKGIQFIVRSLKLNIQAQ